MQEISIRLRRIAVLVLFCGGFLSAQDTIPGAGTFLSAQDTIPGPGNSLSVRGGYAWSQGDWTSHPYAPVSYFKQGLVFGGEFAFRLSDNAALALTGLYSHLNTGDWEDYALGMGDTVEGSASMVFLAVAYRAYLIRSRSDLFSLDIGPLVLLASGSETIGPRSFNYDFMSSPGFGALAALEYDRSFGKNTAAFLRVEGIVVPAGLDYASGHSFAVVTFPLTIGVRLLY
jgi:hypothetical protein